MARHVKGPDGVIHEFPDDATDQEISAALTAPPTKPDAPRRGWVDMGVDALPMIGGAVGGFLGGASGIPTLGLGSVPGAIAGAGALGAGGEAVKQLINRARGAEVPATPGAAAGDIALQGGVQGALEGAGQGISAAATPVAKAVYRGYLKPSLAKINIGKATQIIDTAFKENLPISHGAVTEAGRRIGELKARVDALLASATGDVDLHTVADKVRTWARAMYGRAGRAPEDLDAALQVAERIDNHPSMAPTPPMARQDIVDLPTANTVKRDLQEGVGTSQYGIPSKAGKTAEKVGASEMRTAIEAKAPEVGSLNMRESRLIDLARSLRQATGREANKNAFFGVPSIISGMAGAEEYGRTKNPYSAAATALAMRVGLHPAVATRAALLASRIAEKVPAAVISDVARAAVQAVSETQQEP